MADEPGTLPSQSYPTATLGSRKPKRFVFAPDADQRSAIASALDLLDLPAFEMKGEIMPSGRQDYRLVATLTAKIVQACIISLRPVPATLNETVNRIYRHDYSETAGDEVELSAEEDAEPLPSAIDVAEVAIEALTLALPLYPRAPGAELGQQNFAPPGVSPLQDGDLKPFAGLAGLAQALKGKGETQD